jgi:hypothetical protein
MLKRTKQLLITGFILMFLHTSCQDDDTFPVTPEIKFLSLDKYSNVSSQDSLVLSFSFTDGDGDLGSKPEDVNARDIFLRLFEFKNDVFVEPALGAPLEYRMPYLEPRGNNSSLKGEVKINVDYNILQPNDTIRYEIYIKDRAGHQSNTVTSSTIITRIE